MRSIQKICCSALLIASSLVSFSADAATSGQFGLGVEFGEPTGITGKYWVDQRTAYDFGLSYSFSDFFLLYGDYLYHFPHAFDQVKEPFFRELQPYIGVGPELFVSTQANRTGHSYFADSTSSDIGLGIRIPLGIEWLPKNVPLGVFAELVPGIGFVPSTFGFFQGGVGARYYF